MYVNKCTKCGKEFETKNPKRVICPDCLYPDKSMIIQSEVEPKADQPLQSYSTPEAPRNYPPRTDYNRGGYQQRDNGYNRPQQGGYQQREGGYNRPPQQGNYQPRDNGYSRPQQGGYQQREGGYNRPPQQGNYQPRDNGYNRPQQGGYQQREGGYNRPPQQGNYQPRDNGYNRPQQGGYQQRDGARPPQGGFRPRFNNQGGRPMPRNNKPLLVNKEQLEKIEVIYKTMLPLPNPDAHEVIGAHIDLEPRKVFFGINLVRQKMMLPKLPFPKRKLAISPDQLFAIKNLYEPLLPVPPIGCHKIIAAQLRMDEWRVHVGIGLVRAEMGLDRWNPDRADAPAEFKLKAEENAKATAKEAKRKTAKKETTPKKTEKAEKPSKVTKAKAVKANKDAGEVKADKVIKADKKIEKPIKPVKTAKSAKNTDVVKEVEEIKEKKVVKKAAAAKTTKSAKTTKKAKND